MDTGKITIVEAVKSALRSQQHPMTVNEICDAILARNLYKFSTKNVQHVVATQIRRHLEGSAVAEKSEKFFKAVGNKFSLIERR